MLVVTTPTLAGSRITRTFGLVSGEAILGANTVVGVDLDYETISAGGSMLMVSASGTAVFVEPE